MWHLNAAAIAVALMAAGSQFAAPAARADSPAPPIRGNPGDTQARRIWHKPHHIAAQGGPQDRSSRPGNPRRSDRDRRSAPFSSIIYDLDGDAWVYKVAAPLTYVREGVVIERIKGDHAYLKEGPPAGTQIVTVGVPELYGTEVGVNGE